MGLACCAFEKGEGLLVPRPIPAPGSALGLLPSSALSSAQVTESIAESGSCAASAVLCHDDSMQDRQLYAQILGIRSPWQVQNVELRLDEGEVHIDLGHREGLRWDCPQCGRECALYDHQPERRWRHLDTCQYRTILYAKPPRSDCPEHGPLVVQLPWAEAGSHLTALLEALAIDWLRAASQKAVGERLGLSWEEIHGVMLRAVKRGLERRQVEPLTYLGVDEKSFRKRHRYVTIVTDWERSRVLHVAPERRQASLDEFWPTLSEEQKQGLRAIAMDRWDPYIASVREHLAEANGKIVFDKFPIAGHLSKAVDRVRRREHKQLKRQGDLRLAGSKYDWLRHPARFSDEAWREFQLLRDSNLKTARAWALKETLMCLFDLPLRRRGSKLLSPLVLVGQPQPLAAASRSGKDAQATTRQHRHLSATSHHQRHHGIAELQDPMGEVDGARLS